MKFELKNHKKGFMLTNKTNLKPSVTNTLLFHKISYETITNCVTKPRVKDYFEIKYI